MKLVVDMNMPIIWIGILNAAGLEAVHWSTVGFPKAADEEIMSWALNNDCVVLTFDLDFGRILALTGATGPSVIQIRASHALKATELAPYVISVIDFYSEQLSAGAIVSLDLESARVRLLPFEK